MKTKSSKRKARLEPADLKRRARELRDLRRDLQEVWGDLMMTLRLMIRDMEGR